MRIKRGDIVWIVPGRRGGLIETQVKSIGPKYITTEYRDMKFHTDNLREVNGIGVSSILILDKEKYETDKYYEALIMKLERFDWGSISREELDKVNCILENSINKEE